MKLALVVCALAIVAVACGDSRPPSIPVSITSSEFGELGAVTTAGAVCEAAVHFPSDPPKNPGHKIGEPVTADASGHVTWSYARSASIPAGTGTQTVTCRSGQARGSARAQFEVESED
jgi:hypothetical protein